MFKQIFFINNALLITRKEKIARAGKKYYFQKQIKNLNEVLAYGENKENIRA